MKKSLALILAVLMLVPCFLTAASAAWGDPKVEEPAEAAEGYARVKDEYTMWDDGVLDKDVTEWSYNKAGQLTKEIKKGYRQDEDTDEEFLAWTETTAYVYDGSCDLIKKVSSVVYHNGRTSKEVTVYVYNQDGDLVKESRGYKGYDGCTEKSVIKYSYDRNDNLVKRTATIVERSGTRREISAYAYDKNGRLKKESAVVYFEDRLEKTVTAFAYDKKGNVTKKAVRFYLDRVLQWTAAEANAYNKQGGLTKTRYAKRIENGNTTQYTRLYTYWKNGNLKKTVDTNPDNPDYRRTITYNKDGKLLMDKTIVGYEKDDEGQRSAIEIIRICEYDENGRLTYDYFLDPIYGNDGASGSTRYTYDENGNVLTADSSRSEEDYYVTEKHVYTYLEIGA